MDGFKNLCWTGEDSSQESRPFMWFWNLREPSFTALSGIGLGSTQLNSAAEKGNKQLESRARQNLDTHWDKHYQLRETVCCKTLIILIIKSFLVILGLLLVFNFIYNWEPSNIKQIATKIDLARVTRHHNLDVPSLYSRSFLPVSEASQVVAKHLIRNHSDNYPERGGEIKLSK